MSVLNTVGGGFPDCETPNMPKQAISPTIQNNLLSRKKRLEEDLANVNAALKALEENPKMLEVLELLAKCR